MAFPVEHKYIELTESDLGVTFPEIFRSRMIKMNGGETQNEKFQVFPFWDKSDRKRISRTSNHIGLKTKNARTWAGFPEDGIAIGGDGSGNLLILRPFEKNELSETIYLWDHETRKIIVMAESIFELDKNY